MNPFLVPPDYFDRLAPAGPDLVNDPVRFRRYAALLRMRALAALVAARHGWLGASFSALEILAAIHHLHIPDPRVPLAERARLVLSKGHAAAGHYALLSALGAIAPERLLTYKAAGGLPAHVEAGVPGVDAGSGSLGQGLSKGIGLALAARARGRKWPVFVLLGDGELQEGQVFESLLTLASKNLVEVVPIVDRNGLQTDSSTADVKDAADWPAVFRGIGLDVAAIDGHDGPALAAALGDCADRARPRVLIARTEKGYGTALTRMPRDAARRTAVWHGRIPDAGEYAAMLRDLAATAGFPDLAAEVETYLAKENRGPGSATPAGCRGGTPAMTVLTTGEAFGRALADLGDRFPDLHVLDADLEKACRLNPFAERHPARFHEQGISEQDMVSTACGIGLAGGIAVANTFAAFHRRALDQAFCAALDGVPVILAGHYAGLDYHTDGRTHQSLTDLALFRGLGGIDAYEPLTARETELLLERLVEDYDRRLRAGLPCRPAYVRLHRAPAAREVALPAGRFEGVYEFPHGPERAPVALAVASPHFLVAALDAQAALAAVGMAFDIVAVSGYDLGGSRLAALLAGRRAVLALESHAARGGLADAIVERTGVAPVRLCADEPAGCCRTLGEALGVHGLAPEELTRAIREFAGGGKG